jgi:hypothetical protein
MSYQVGRVSEMLLLSAWIVGYHILIRTFAALQGVERLLKGSSQKGQAGTDGV